MEMPAEISFVDVKNQDTNIFTVVCCWRKTRFKTVFHAFYFLLGQLVG